MLRISTIGVAEIRDWALMTYQKACLFLRSRDYLLSLARSRVACLGLAGMLASHSPDGSTVVIVS